jgi:outer membrane usher protein FimD/PapC
MLTLLLDSSRLRVRWRERCREQCSVRFRGTDNRSWGYKEKVRDD